MQRVVIVVLGSAVIASGVSKIVLGELFGAPDAVQLIAWFGTFALCVVIDLTPTPAGRDKPGSDTAGGC